MFNPNYVFDNFVSTASNRFARAACLTFARSTHLPYNPLFLYGPTGIGKTHLLHAMGNSAARLRPDGKIILVSSDSMTHGLYESLINGQIARFRAKYTTADFLIVDDIHILSGRERTQEEFFRIFEALIANGGRLAMASLKPPSDIWHFSCSLRSRMKDGLMLPIMPPSRHDLELILSKKFASTIPPIPADLIGLVSQQRKDSDIRRAVGMVKQLVFAGSQSGSA
jgi:chromosomal replication initiator protein